MSVGNTFRIGLSVGWWRQLQQQQTRNERYAQQLFQQQQYFLDLLREGKREGRERERRRGTEGRESMEGEGWEHCGRSPE